MPIKGVGSPEPQAPSSSRPRTLAFQARNAGSNPVGATIKNLTAPAFREV